MKITKLKWAGPERNSLKVTFTDDKGVSRDLFAPWPCQTWHREHIQAFMDANTVDPEDPPPPPVDRADVANQNREVQALVRMMAELLNKPVGEVTASFRKNYNAV